VGSLRLGGDVSGAVPKRDGVISGGGEGAILLVCIVNGGYIVGRLVLRMGRILCYHRLMQMGEDLLPLFVILTSHHPLY
jgi:hypothetical protein